MAKNAVTDWDENPNLNTDIGGTNIDEGCAPSGMNNAVRTVMSQLKTFFKSSVFQLRDSTDQTKLLAFSLSGLTTATTRTLTVQDKNGTIALTSDVPAAGYLPGASVYFTANGTFTKASYPGLRAVRARVQASGGSGGGSSTTANRGAGGGGAGGYTEEFILVAALAASETVTVGTKGLAGGSSASGGNGNTSSFGAFCQATGGSGGPTPAGGNGGQGGVGSGGDLNIAGGDGDPPNINLAMAGSGGDAMLGGGGSGGVVNTRGLPAGNYGGGGGGSSTTTVAALAGHDGGPGIVIIDLFY